MYFQWGLLAFLSLSSPSGDGLCAPTLQDPQSNAKEPWASQKQRAAHPIHSSPQSKDILHQIQSVQLTIPSARAGTTFLMSSHQNPRVPGWAEAALPWRELHLLNQHLHRQHPLGKHGTGSLPSGKWEGHSDNAKNLVQIKLSQARGEARIKSGLKPEGCKRRTQACFFPNPPHCTTTQTGTK